MSKKKDDVKEKKGKSTTTEVVEAASPAAPSPVSPAPAPKVTPRAPKLYSFSQWAKMRRVKAHHLGGMRAFCGSVEKNRTLEEWDEIFKAY